MPILKSRTLVVALAVVSAVAMLGSLRLGAITYGWLDGEHHPNVGAMFAEIDGTVYRICSGTLIAPQVFLTASHCTVYLDWAQSQGQLGWVGVSFKTDPPHGSAVIHGSHYTNPATLHVWGVTIAGGPVASHSPAAQARQRLPYPASANPCAKEAVGETLVWAPVPGTTPACLLASTRFLVIHS